MLADVSGLPPACLTIAEECDVLAEQGPAMEARLRAAGTSA